MASTAHNTMPNCPAALVRVFINAKMLTKLCGTAEPTSYGRAVHLARAAVPVKGLYCLLVLLLLPAQLPAALQGVISFLECVRC